MHTHTHTPRSATAVCRSYNEGCTCGDEHTHRQFKGEESVAATSLHGLTKAQCPPLYIMCIWVGKVWYRFLMHCLATLCSRCENHNFAPTNCFDSVDANGTKPLATLSNIKELLTLTLPPTLGGIEQQHLIAHVFSIMLRFAILLYLHAALLCVTQVLQCVTIVQNYFFSHTDHVIPNFDA